MGDTHLPTGIDKSLGDRPPDLTGSAEDEGPPSQKIPQIRVKAPVFDKRKWVVWKRVCVLSRLELDAPAADGGPFLTRGGLHGSLRRSRGAGSRQKL
jgi:hypothetical protein